MSLNGHNKPEAAYYALFFKREVLPDCDISAGNELRRIHGTQGIVCVLLQPKWLYDNMTMYA